MSGIMSLFNGMFNGGAAANGTPAGQPTGQQQQPPGPGQIPASAPNTGATGAGTAPNGTVPNSGDGNPAPASTPFDQFSDLWKTPEPSGDQKPTGVFGEVDPKKFMEAAGKIDFTKVVTPEQLQKITAGGEDAMKAFVSALNSVAQTTYAQSAFAATKITEQAVNRARDSFFAELPQHIKKQTVSESLRQENPVFANPAVQPIISALEAQLSVKFPQASAGELTQMAKQYVEALGTSFAPKPAEDKSGTGGKPGSRQEEDWSGFLA